MRLLSDTFLFMLIHFCDPISDMNWREFRATRRWSRKEITTKEAYRVLTKDKS